MKAYASRGGFKLEHALKEFKIDVKDKVVLDIGASHGGFTDCLLQHGAAKVYAVDVAYGIFDWKLRNDPRVVVMERTNARYLTAEDLIKKEKTPNSQLRTPNFAAIDVSFISLDKILPVVEKLLVGRGEVIALVKPQFEAQREEVGRGGIVRDEGVREKVIERIKAKAQAIGFKVKGITPSPIEGAKGNVEYLLYLAKE
ncbi:MAG: TlyA family RNA methyltransferase [bacterium]